MISVPDVDECKLDDSDTGEFFTGALGTNSCKQKGWIQNQLVINNLQLNMKLDTGAQCNVLPHFLYCKLTREKSKKSNTRPVFYTGHKIPVKGAPTS